MDSTSAHGLLDYSLEQYSKAGYRFVTVRRLSLRDLTMQLKTCLNATEEAYISPLSKPQKRTSAWHC